MPAETFTLNLKYVSNAIRVSLVPTKAEKKNPQDVKNDGLNAAVEKERNMVAQANIVKIMKTNKDIAVKH